jgi:hypothetical protein
MANISTAAAGVHRKRRGGGGNGGGRVAYLAQNKRHRGVRRNRHRRCIFINGGIAQKNSGIAIAYIMARRKNRGMAPAGVSARSASRGCSISGGARHIAWRSTAALAPVIKTDQPAPALALASKTA